MISKIYTAHDTTFRKIGNCSDQFFRPNHLAPDKGLQGATAHTAATARNTGANLFYFRKVNWVLLHALHNTSSHGTNGFTSNLKDEAMGKCLAEGHTCHGWGFEPTLC